MKTIEISTFSIVKAFAQASLNKEFERLEHLLCDEGIFEIQSRKLNTLETTKRKFLKWYKTKLNETEITDVVYDQCLHCHLGNSVVIFNSGKFPRLIKDSSERSKTGFMVDVKDDKIKALKFCFVFLKTENRYQFEYTLKEIKEFEIQGFTFKEAYKKVKGIDYEEDF